MHKILTIFFILTTVHAFSQQDRNGNPVFNSVSTGRETIGNFELISNYYTLKNNIETRTSSVYISPNPTLDQVEKAAIDLPSEMFLITRKSAAINMIMLRNKPVRLFFVVNALTGKGKEFACTIIGDITENRANEIMRENYDSKAKIIGDKLFFNNKELVIIPNAVVKKAAIELIEQQKLGEGDASKMIILTKDELKKIVLTETKEGGKMDFFTAIKGHENDGVELKPGLFATELSAALYIWGRSNFELGVNTVEDALEFWVEFKGRPVSQKEKDYITLGFNKGLEK